jgi:hypothetical protein
MPNGKGSGRRPAAISPAEETVAWAVAFGKPICPDCTAGARNLPEMWTWEPCARHRLVDQWAEVARIYREHVNGPLPFQRPAQPLPCNGQPECPICAAIAPETKGQ